MNGTCYLDENLAFAQTQWDRKAPVDNGTIHHVTFRCKWALTFVYGLGNKRKAHVKIYLCPPSDGASRLASKRQAWNAGKSEDKLISCKYDRQARNLHTTLTVNLGRRI